MALVTYGVPVPQRFVIGNLVMKFFVVNGATGSTLNTGMQGIVWFDTQANNQAGGPSLITGMTLAANGVITLTSSAPMVNEVIQIIGREG